MAKGKTQTVTTIRVNNAKTHTSIAAKHVELTVVNGRLVPDDREVDAGVIMR